MARKDRKDEDLLEKSNAKAIAEMLADPDTPPHLRVKMLNKANVNSLTDVFISILL